MNHRFYHTAWILLNVLLLSVTQVASVSAQIEIDAGNTSGVCHDGILELIDLEAFITGDVLDGTWLSSGDGIFLPQNSGIGNFISSTHYVPGSLDKQIGTISFTLASDPHPVSGIIETDQVSILVVEDIPLACNDFVSVGLDGDCEVLITPQHLINNASSAFNLYNIELYTLNGLLIPTDTIGLQFLDQYINFTVQESCDSTICWGQILVMDNLAPQLTCLDTVISCLDILLPDSLGFPVEYDSIISGPNNSYILVNGDNCGDVIASYIDDEIEQECFEEYQLIIERTWTVMDTSNNSSQCVQTIFLEKLDLFDVVFPENFDGNEMPVLDCSVLYPLDSFGNPDPIYTGFPLTEGCIYLSSTYEDINYSSCGNTQKILRTWNVVEWCSSQIRTESQLIELADTLAPEIECVELIQIAVNPYQCNILNETIETPSITDNCNTWMLSATIRKNGIQMYYISDLTSTLDLPDLALGDYTIHWMAEDVCENMGSCVTELQIVDQSEPFAICLDVNTVSVGNSGAGRLFPNSVNNGSFDNCTALDFRLRKLTDVCFNNTEFGFFIDFCCEEIGSTIMVELEVTDENGLSNYCMTEVLVEDKAAPIVTCPSDLTVSCTYFNSVVDYDAFGMVQSDPDSIQDIIIQDPYNNGIVGMDGFYQDNCGATITSSFVLDMECSTGTLSRTFIAIDGSNNVDSCTQTITIINDGSFEEEDIVWPLDFEYVACDTAFLDPDISGEPTWLLEDCSLISSTYEDEVFVLTDTACVKIVRTWSVIDWCQYDENTGYGLWTEEQVIKINNLVAPEFDSCTDSISFCITEDNCYQSFYMEVSATDDCTAEVDLEFIYSIDLGANGFNDHSGIGSAFYYELPVGTHKLIWRVEDRCGNYNFCTQTVIVEDCKSPTPYCLGSLTMALDENGTVEVWANEYNLGGSDNCTDVQDLLISFAEEVYTPVLEFDCGDIADGMSENILLDVWYIDEYGNAEFCTVELILQDNQDSCPDVIPNDYIHGRVQDSKGDNIPQLAIDLDCELADHSQSIASPDGDFIFENLPNELYYSIHCSKVDTYLKGVTTLDILLIQRHILGLTLLPNGYDELAADVNLSGRVTGIDIVALRKLILGINETLPATNAPWKFVKSDNATAELDPWSLSENVDLYLNAENGEQNIVGIKYGDVNSSWSFNGSVETENRSNGLPLELNKYREGDHWKYDFKLLEDIGISAFQVSLNTNEQLFDIEVNAPLIGFGDSHYYINNKNIRISWNTNAMEEEAVDNILFSFESIQDLNIDIDMDFNNMLYTNSTVFDFRFRAQDDGIEAIPNFNVFTTSDAQIAIESDTPSDEIIEVEVYDLQGRKVLSSSLQIFHSGAVGYVDYSPISQSGIYTVLIASKTQSQAQKLFLSIE